MEDKREKIVKQLLLAWQLDNLPEVPPQFADIPESATVGLTEFNRKFLSSVASQVSEKGFITGKQFAAVVSALSQGAMSYQFSLGYPLPRIPPDFRWVNFEEDLERRLALSQVRPLDVQNAADQSIQVGGVKLDLTKEINKPWGTLSAEDGELVFTPSRYPTTNIKKAGRFAWDKDTKTWRHNGVHAETVHKVLEVFGQVEIDESLDLALAANTAVVELPEDIKDHGTLFEFQKEATQFLLSNPKCLLALAPGLGKTATAILAAQSLMDDGTIGSVGIVAPKSLLRTWQIEIEKWVPGSWSTILHPDFRNQPLDGDWYIVNYDQLSVGSAPEELDAVDLIIFDESILLKTHNRTKKAIDGRNRWVFKTKRVQVAFEYAKKTAWTWLLSGGPTSKFVDDLWAQLHILDPKRFSSYWRFAEDYCLIEQNPWTKVVTGNKPGAIDLIHEHYADIIFARSQDQVLDLPDWIFEDVEIPMTKKQEQLYDRMKREWIAELETQQGPVKLTAPNVLVHTIRLSQIASNQILLGEGITAMSPKWNAVLEQLELRPLPAIIWTQYVETAERMEHHLTREGYRVAKLVGKTPASIRNDIVTAFQNGDLDIIVAHPKVGKFGLTLTRTRTAIYLEASFDSDDYYQSLHRVRRIGTTHSPLVIRMKSIYSDGSPTIDHIIWDVLDEKSDTTFNITAAALKLLLEGSERKDEWGEEVQEALDN